MITLAEVMGLFQTNNAAHELEVFDKAVTVFEKYEVPGYLEAFDATIGAAVDDGDSDIIRNIMVDVRAISESLMQLQGVTLHEEVLLSDILDLAEAVHDLPYHEDREIVLATLDIPESSEEIFARLVELRNGEPVEKTLGLVQSVDENIPDIIRAAISHHDEDVRAAAEDAAIIAGYKKFKTACASDKALVADQWVRNAPTIGLDLSFYVDQLQLLKHIDLSNPSAETFELLALELFALAVLSCDAHSTPAQSLREHQEKFFVDLSEATKLDMAISKVSQLYNEQA